MRPNLIRGNITYTCFTQLPMRFLIGSACAKHAEHLQHAHMILRNFRSHQSSCDGEDTPSPSSSQLDASSIYIYIQLGVARVLSVLELGLDKKEPEHMNSSISPHQMNIPNALPNSDRILRCHCLLPRLHRAVASSPLNVYPSNRTRTPENPNAHLTASVAHYNRIGYQ